MLKENTSYDFNIDKIFSYALDGVNKATAFIGAVLNKNNSFNINQWKLEEQFDVTPTIQNSPNVLKGFKDFVIKNALCEMIMSFEITLNELYDGLLIITRTVKGKYSTLEHKKIMKKFLSDKFEDKLKKINQILQNITENDFWTSLKYIRNCIEHNYSKVNKGTIKLMIPMVEIKFIDQVTKKEYLFTPENPESSSLHEIAGHPAQVIIDIKKNREKIFNNGDIISFTKSEINFLIAAMNDSINFLKVHVLEYILEKGYGLNFRGTIIKTKEELRKILTKREIHITINQKSEEKCETKIHRRSI